MAEAGGAGGLDPADVETHLHGIRNVMRFFQMIAGEPATVGPRVMARDQFVVDARRGGLLRLAVTLGAEITKGQEIAQVCNVFGEVVETLVAPRDGIVRLIWTHKAVNTGDPIVKCWEVESAPPFPATDRYMQNPASHA
jgi:predicted deacylase